MSADFPTLSEIGEENIRQRIMRMNRSTDSGTLRKYQEEDFDE